MVNVLKQILGNRDNPQAGGSKGIMSLLGQGEKLVWWRPVIIPFRPLVILYNMIMKGGGQPRFASQRLVSTNEQVYEISWDQLDRPTKVVVHRKVHEA